MILNCVVGRVRHAQIAPAMKHGQLSGPDTKAELNDIVIAEHVNQIQLCDAPPDIMEPQRMARPVARNVQHSVNHTAHLSQAVRKLHRVICPLIRIFPMTLAHFHSHQIVIMEIEKHPVKYHGVLLFCFL